MGNVRSGGETDAFRTDLLSEPVITRTSDRGPVPESQTLEGKAKSQPITTQAMERSH